MSFLDSILSPTKMTGYVADDAQWLRSLPHHDVFAGGERAVPDWTSLAPKFRPQESTMMCTAFAGCAVASMLEKFETGKGETFSPIELFARSHGSHLGNTVQNTINAMASGLTKEEDCPWVTPVGGWDSFVVKLYSAYAKASEKVEKAYAIRGATYVTPTHEAIRAALQQSPVYAIVNVGRGYFDNPAPAVSSGSAHAVVITEVADDGKIRIFDSLTQGQQGYDGFHWLSPSFPILYAFGIMDLPNGWETKQETEMEKMYRRCLIERYGQYESAIRERAAKDALAIARAKNPTHASFLDGLWEVYVYAVAYGGYSVQDVLNHITSIRRGNGPIFDFNSKR